MFTLLHTSTNEIYQHANVQLQNIMWQY